MSSPQSPERMDWEFDPPQFTPYPAPGSKRTFDDISRSGTVENSFSQSETSTKSFSFVGSAHDHRSTSLRPVEPFFSAVTPTHVQSIRMPGSFDEDEAYIHPSSLRPTTPMPPPQPLSSLQPRAPGALPQIRNDESFASRYIRLGFTGIKNMTSYIIRQTLAIGNRAVHTRAFQAPRATAIRAVQVANAFKRRAVEIFVPTRGRAQVHRYRDLRQRHLQSPLRTRHQLPFVPVIDDQTHVEPHPPSQQHTEIQTVEERIVKTTTVSQTSVIPQPRHTQPSFGCQFSTDLTAQEHACLQRLSGNHHRHQSSSMVPTRSPFWQEVARIGESKAAAYDLPKEDRELLVDLLSGACRPAYNDDTTLEDLNDKNWLEIRHCACRIADDLQTALVDELIREYSRRVYRRAALENIAVTEEFEELLSYVKAAVKARDLRDYESFEQLVSVAFNTFQEHQNTDDNAFDKSKNAVHGQAAYRKANFQRLALESESPRRPFGNLANNTVMLTSLVDTPSHASEPSTNIPVDRRNPGFTVPFDSDDDEEMVDQENRSHGILRKTAAQLDIRPRKSLSWHSNRKGHPSNSRRLYAVNEQLDEFVDMNSPSTPEKTGKRPIIDIPVRIRAPQFANVTEPENNAVVGDFQEVLTSPRPVEDEVATDIPTEHSNTGDQDTFGIDSLRLSPRKASRRIVTRSISSKAEEERKLKETLAKKPRVPRIIPDFKVITPLSHEWEQKLTSTMQSASLDNIVSEKFKLTKKDLNTLLPGTWLNDEIITAYLTAIVNHANDQAPAAASADPSPFFAFNTFFYPKLRQSGPKSVARWTKRAGINGLNLLKLQKVFIPVHQSSHWTLLVISPQERVVEYFDSLRGQGTTFLGHARSFLEAELGSAYHHDEWQFTTGECSRQSNGFDCGVFLLTSAKMVAAGYGCASYTQEDIPVQRRRIGAELIAGQLF